MEKLRLELSGKKNLEKYVRLFLGGEKGSGRTEFALSGPDPLLLSAYCGEATLAQNPGVPYITVQGEGTLHGAVKLIREGMLTPQTVIIDTLTEVQRRLFLRRLAEEQRVAPNFDDWAWVGAKLNSIIKSFADLEVNLIIIADLKHSESDELRPAIQGSFATDVFNYVDYAGYVAKKGSVIEETIEVDNSEDIGLVTQLRYTEPQIFFKPTVNVTWPFNMVNSVGELDPVIHSFAKLQELHEVNVANAPSPVDIVFEDFEDDPIKEILPTMSYAEQINQLFSELKQSQQSE